MGYFFDPNAGRRGYYQTGLAVAAPVPAQPTAVPRGSYRGALFAPGVPASPEPTEGRGSGTPTWLKVLGLGILGSAAVWAIYESSLTTRERHDRELVRTAKSELRKGAHVFADAKGWPKPPITNGRRADVISIKGRRVKLIEIEHEHTLDTKHTREQVDDLAEFCESAEDFECTFEIRLTKYRHRGG